MQNNRNLILNDCRDTQVNNVSCSRVLHRVVAEFSGLFQGQHYEEQILFHKTISKMHELCVSIREAELEGLSPAIIADHLEPARKLHGLSPFVERLQVWPKGYTGDYETIEYLCDGVNRASENSPAFFIEKYALLSGIAQQHRNKIAWQATRILDVCQSSSGRTRILSIGCGSSRDLRSIQSLLSAFEPSIVLNDIDRDALSCSLQQLPCLANSIQTVPGDVFQVIRTLKRAGPYDLILVGGVFDYLDDRHAEWLLAQLRYLIPKNGSICFTNIRKNNPYRVWMEYLANWKLVERSAGDIELLLEKANLVAGFESEIRLDETQLTYLVEIAI